MSYYSIGQLIATPTLTDWIFYLSQVVLNLLGIWLGFYLYFRQQREAQNNRYDAINKNLADLSQKMNSVDHNIGELEKRLIIETAELRGQVSQIDRTTHQTHNKLIDAQAKITMELIHLPQGVLNVQDPTRERISAESSKTESK